MGGSGDDPCPLAFLGALQLFSPLLRYAYMPW